MFYEAITIPLDLPLRYGADKINVERQFANQFVDR